MAAVGYMSIEEYRKQVDERGCGCRQCNPPREVDTRYAHLVMTRLTGSNFWLRKREIAKYNELVERVLKNISWVVE